MDKHDLMKSIFLGDNIVKITSENVITLEIDELKDFHTGEYGHTYKVTLNSDMEKLMESIERVGINEPLIVRKDPEDEKFYEVISGHRRKFAASQLNIKTVPAIIRNYTDDEAIITMCDGNLQREDISPSEKAKTYKAKYEALKRQGQRTDLTLRQLGAKLKDGEILDDNLTLRQVGAKLRTSKIMALNSDDSARQIERYIKLNDLTEDMLNLVDEGKLKFNIAVEIAYLPKEIQDEIYNLITVENKKISLQQIKELKENIKENNNTNITFLTKEDAKKIKLKLDEKIINSILPEDIKKLSAEDKLEYLKKAIYEYSKISNI